MSSLWCFGFIIQCMLKNMRSKHDRVQVICRLNGYMETMTAAALFCVDHCSDFVFDPVKWPRVQMEEDFLKLSQTFKAIRSVVRVPALDPKYKIAVLASKQVCIITLVSCLLFSKKFCTGVNILFFILLQDHCLVDLLHGWQDGRLPVDITCVIR